MKILHNTPHIATSITTNLREIRFIKDKLQNTESLCQSMLFVEKLSFCIDLGLPTMPLIR